MRTDEHSAASPVLARADDGRIAFGIPVQNRGDARLRLHRLPTSRVELTSGRTTIAAEVRLSGMIRPGETRSCRVRLTLPPHTPPGEYEGEVSVHGEVRAVRVVVPPVREVEARPRRIVCEAVRDGREIVEFSIWNRGNVPVSVRHPMAVRAEPRNRSCRVLRSALALSTKTEPPGPIVDALVQAAADSAAADPILAAQIDGAPFELAPGETRRLRMALRLAIAERGVYRALLDVAGTRIHVEIHAYRGKGEGE